MHEIKPAWTLPDSEPARFVWCFEKWKHKAKKLIPATILSYALIQRVKSALKLAQLGRLETLQRTENEYKKVGVGDTVKQGDGKAGIQQKTKKTGPDRMCLALLLT
ncbi:hypothetical protein [Rugosibacter aromaticivorans]|uniref:hypothetical protein n=1 Tax=Rugosibacter aromaticivorans TaxID=1565605 RepID=UPI0012243EC5|nr:hypothetical protein [Rugosibacter aromaticivorans]TBR14050.1 MAG: hypothetical protein EPO43_08740 [Rugosibacter sp.]